jgi:hypothetical protein
MSSNIDPCVYCGESTAFGFGKFVNRLSVDDGWGCAECSGFECDGCDKQIYLDSDVSDSNGEGHYHEQCVPQECSRCEKQTLPINLASTDGEIPFCKECIGVCRLCSRDGFHEDTLEHGVCESCCLDLDELAEEEE